MKLEDDAIRLRPFTLDDVPALVAALDGDEDVARWTHIPSPYTEGDAREFITSTSETAFAVCDAATGDLIEGSASASTTRMSSRSDTG